MEDEKEVEKEDQKEQTYLILDSKTTLVFRENVASEIASTPLLNSVSIPNISDSQHTMTLLQKVLIITIMKCFVYFKAYQWIFQLWNKQIYR